MALADRPDPGKKLFVDRFVFALRHFGPTPATPIGNGKKLGRKAPHVRHVVREIAVYADWNDGTCSVCGDTLAEGLGLTRQTVSAAVQAAVATGWLTVRKAPAPSRSGKDWGVNSYRLIIPDEAELKVMQWIAGRESRQATSGAPSGESSARADGRRESRQATGDACRVSGDACRENTDACRESRRERVGKADTNLSVEHSLSSLEHGARARADVSLEQPPEGWQPPADMQEPGALLRLMTPDDKSDVRRLLSINTRVEPTAGDLTLLGGFLRSLQWRIAQRGEGKEEA